MNTETKEFTKQKILERDELTDRLMTKDRKAQD